MVWSTTSSSSLGQAVEVDLVAQPGAECLHDPSRVVVAAVEAPVHRLDAPLIGRWNWSAPSALRPLHRRYGLLEQTPAATLGGELPVDTAPAVRSRGR